MDNLEDLVLGPSPRYYADPELLEGAQMPPEKGKIYYYRYSPLDKEIRRILDRATGELSKQTA